MVGFTGDFFKASHGFTIASRTPNKGVVNNKALGTTGTEIYAGFFDEEYLAKLLAEDGIDAFDKMRRSDGQVKMLLSVVKNPIRAATWVIEAVDETDIAKEHADFATHVIMNDITNKNGKHKTFTEFITEVLTNIEYGFSAFEIVHKQVKNHKRFGDYLGLADLGFRHQRSILQWGLREDGSIGFIRQLVNGDLDVDVDIPGQFMLIFSNEKEGDNYEGISMLRPCYGNWFRKNIYRKLQAIGIERSAKGVPIGIMPAEMINRPDYQAQLDAFQELLDKLSSHEKNGVVIGAGFEMTELKITHDSDKVQKVISSENVEMSKAFLANFMELGLEANGGSYSLGSDLSDIFLGGIEYMAKEIVQKLNHDLVIPLIKAKYGELDEYPKMTVKGINDKAGKEFAESISKLLREGGVQKSPRLQKHIHELYKLSSFDEELAEQQQELLLNPPTAPEPGNDPEDKPAKPGKPPAAKKTDNPGKTKETIEDPEKKKLNDHDCGAHTFVLNDEQRKEFPVSALIEDQATKLEKIMRAGLKARSAAMLSAMEKVIRAGKNATAVRNVVLSITMPGVEEYVDSLRAWADETIKKTVKGTLKELGRNETKLADDLDELPLEMRERVIRSVLLLAGFQDSDIEKAVYFSFNENYLLPSDAEAAIEKMNKANDDYFDKRNIGVASVNASSNTVNNTRDDVFHTDDVFKDIESFIFANPAPVTAICNSLVGTVFSKEEYESSRWLPPLHHNCKSYIIAQTIGVKTNQKITPGGLTVTDPELIKQATL